MIDKKYRNDFPLLCKENPPIFFDNACMTLKPNVVIDSMTEYYRDYPVCEGRSGHSMALRLNSAMIASRKAMQQYIGASHHTEVAFTKNTSESLNIVASGIDWKKGDVMLVSDKEHNSNFLPWQCLREIGVHVEVVPSNENGLFSIDNWKHAIEEHKPRLLTCYMTSNLDGETTPVAKLCDIAKKHGTLTCIDGAQGAAHQEINVQEVDCDFLALSVHKMVGPTGVGILYGKMDKLKELKPLLRGGGTVVNVTYDKTDYIDPPRRFEAGLQNYAGIVGTKYAAEYILNIGRKEIHEHEIKLSERLQEQILKLPGVSILGPQNPEDRGGITSIMVDGYNVTDLAMALDEMAGVIMRAGVHCVHGFLNSRCIKGTLRVSTYLYNTIEEIDKFSATLKEILTEE
ncbi:MAG TPA: aminotransferase class V-fold PLP-dependent enzyme [Caldisericia bacterium]|nr:aminotransferase class V-fold PLP-dependent enzyme [Caldisericia bacterium]HPF48862.1 aminotransferase class V-fold PLP-dependent enzyme [Caldisericia bacterium]HPI83274.1 aminotransferase class V-fold PLP-dependent enzyme [Caldisericia bacterium]HPQ92501.1 aminotransferase class V-fold PLP-dependent enzyme [Caldisericia bacterium]HRV74401.1 aminotransferase class V-fold PLP-dependent enzyme [Caldisericia bacterium]